MDPGMADAAERDEVLRVVVRGVVIEMVDVEIPLSTADDAPVPVAVEDGDAHLLPSPQGILLPHLNGDGKPFAVDLAVASCGKRAPAAEPAKTVQVGTVPAEGRLRAIERVQAELEVGAHD